MHLSKITIENFRCFGEGGDRFELRLRPGLTALVGPNDTGKTAVIDALRFVLGTTDQEWYRLEDTDFHQGAGEPSREIRIVCMFEGLGDADKRAFVEYLTYGKGEGDPPVLYLNWTARDTGETYKGRPYRRVELHSGKNGDGPAIAQGARELFQATYLRPLRDAEQALAAGRGSRLAQVLKQTQAVRDGKDFDPTAPIKSQPLGKLSILGIGDLANALLEKHQGVGRVRTEVDEHLENLSLREEGIRSTISVSGARASEEARLRQLLEKLNINLDTPGKPGLGSNNLLSMACELLLLAQEDEGVKVLLIEEPEAHLHAQRQLRAMRFLQEQAKKKGIQIIVTTHSPNLASVIDLENIVLIHGRRAFSLAEGETKLEKTDYRFLQRFLDVTKANLFFARGVMIVEGDAENILLPTLARLLGRDFTEHGVSIVNVGGVGLRRYARIFQRKDVTDEETDKQLGVRVACVTDMDVMPNCAPLITGKVGDGEDWPKPALRRWRVKKEVDLPKARKDILEKASGQCVKSFVSDEWTLEYDLALGPKGRDGQFAGGLAKHVYVAACLAEKEEAINAGRKKTSEVIESALEEFSDLKTRAVPAEGV
jgi:putative ATP-dependent endonuclease of OLD family